MAGKLSIVENSSEVARAGAEQFISRAKESIDDHGSFFVALSGGSTPVAMYKLLASDEHRGKVDWNNVLFFWSDERCVPPDHPDSNYGSARQHLLQPLGITEDRVFRMKGELPPEEAAREYEEIVKKAVPGDPPRFDMIFLGLGDDAHTASLFPETDALHVTDRLVVHNYVPKLNTYRITFTSTLINAAASVVFLVSGEGKAEALKSVLEGEQNPTKYPAQMVNPTSGALLWVVDRAAASLLSGTQ